MAALPNVTAPVPHGGDLERARRRFGEPDAGWLDLSTGMNPWPWPVPALDPAVFHDLPDAGREARVAAAARAYYGAPEGAGTVLAPGSQMLIQLLPLVLPPGRVAVVHPTYGEHARCWALAGHDVVLIDDPADMPGDACALVLANPNNPDGRRWAPETLVDRAATMGCRAALMVVDEAFADVAPGASVAPWTADTDRLLVLRSFGKFFGLAGLRLGVALGAPRWTGALAQRLGRWAVSGPALAVAERAYADTAWIDATRDALARARADLEALLTDAGLTVPGGTDLFVLAEHPDAAALEAHLGRQGILVRAFRDHPAWLRFGLPPDAAARERLRAALSSGP
mgnify:CR=1 FL=1